MFKRFIVSGLEAVCHWLDELPMIWWDRDDGWSVSRHGGTGCVIGVALWSARLDERWVTGHWANSVPFEIAYPEDEAGSEAD